MRWNYNDEYRDEFSKGPHRDILIVPHGTKVTPVAGGPPEITSRVPLFNDDGTPQTSGGKFVMSDVDWVITNKDIVKEQFKYSYSLNPAENITFSSASSAMVQFTIRNNKEYNPDTDTWELDIPNLQYYSYYDKNNNLIIGELEGNYIIKVYTYINGDSSTLLCLGMFRVEEDRAIDNGYSRQITAYDFMATFRDMDIFNWYKRLFDGINKLDNDYIDATNKTGEEQKKPDNYDAEVNWVRKPSKKLYPNRDGRWTIGEALQDLINNLAAFDMIVWSDDGKTAMVGGTSTNPSAVGRDYGEGCGYSGYGMPIVIDPNILDKNAKPYTPTEPGENEYEEYGYMKILELEFYPDPSVLKSGSLSMGKFLEDIGILAGRYPMIRPDKLIEDQTADYFDPRTVTDPKKTRYNTYEKCILTFKPLPTSKDDKTDAGIPKLQPEQQLSNHEIVKGFQHALFDVKDVMIVKIGMRDGEKIEYKILNKTQRKQAETNDLQTFSFSNNLFCSYLVDSSDDDEIKKLLPEYKKIKEKLFGKEKDNHNMTSGALFEDGYYNIKNRSYVPYTLTTYGDPVRDVGDRILINFEDKITGEKTQMYTYILERELSGIQKMMDTYKANGQITSPVFSNYQAGTHYQSGFGMNIQMLGYKHSYGKGSGSSQGKVVGVSPSDLVSYLRNVGIRLLDEPLVASAKFLKSGDVTASYVRAYDHNGSWDHIMPTEGDTETHGLMWCDSADGTKKWNEIEKSEPYECFDGNNGYESDFFIYASNGTWVYHIDDSLVNRSNGDKYDSENLHYMFPVSIKPTTLAPGDTTDLITVNGKEIEVEIGDCLLFKNTSYDDDYFNYVTGLDNFIVNKTGPSGRHSLYEWNNFAWYIAPGVWSTTSGADDPEHRVLQSNSSGDVSHGRIIFENDFDAARWYVPKYCIYPEDLKPGDTTKNIILNDVPITAEYSTSIDINSEGALDGVYYCDTNYSKNNDWISTTMTYVYPGIWVDVGEINVRSLNNYAASSSIKKHVELKWKDPSDISTYEPTPAEWKGTIVIRKEGSAPKHRWDGIEIVRTTTSNKDAYENTPYRDKSIKLGKVYYYGFFPYYKAKEEDGHNINFFRYTKVIKVDTRLHVDVPTIVQVTVDGIEITVDYELPELKDDEYEIIQIWAKPYEIPSSASDAETLEEMGPNDTQVTINVEEGDTSYYLIIYTKTKEGLEAYSDPAEAVTGPSPDIYLFRMDTETDGRDLIHYDESKTVTYNPSQTVWPVSANSYTVTDGQLHTLDEIEPTRNAARSYEINNGSLVINANNSEKDAIIWAFNDTLGYLNYEGEIVINCAVQASDANLLKGLVINLGSFTRWHDIKNASLYINLGNLQSFSDLWHDSSKIFPNNLEANTWYNLKIKVRCGEWRSSNYRTVDYANVYLNGKLIKHYDSNVYTNLRGWLANIHHDAHEGLMPYEEELDHDAYEYYDFFNLSPGRGWTTVTYYLNSVSLFYDSTSMLSQPANGTIRVKNFYVKYGQSKQYKILNKPYYFKPDFYTDGRDTIRYNEQDKTYIYTNTSSYPGYIDYWSKEESTVQPRQLSSGEVFEMHAGKKTEYSSNPDYNDSQLTDDISFSNGIMTVSNPLHYPSTYGSGANPTYINDIEIMWMFGNKMSRYVTYKSKYVHIHIEMKRPEIWKTGMDDKGYYIDTTTIMSAGKMYTVAYPAIDDCTLPPETSILWSDSINGWSDIINIEEPPIAEDLYSTDWHSYDYVITMQDNQDSYLSESYKSYIDGVFYKEDDRYSSFMPGRISPYGIEPIFSGAIGIRTNRGYQFKNFWIKPVNEEPIITPTS